MAKKLQGCLCQITGGKYEGYNALVYHSEQKAEFGTKAFVHVIDKDFNVIMADGKEVSILKEKSTLKVIGFTD